MNKRNACYCLSGLLVAMGIVAFASADAPPTKGRIPDEAFANNSVQLDLVPDYVGALTRDGQLAGYVRKTDIFGREGLASEAPILVVDETLTKPVGRMVPDRGFVPLGTPEESVPRFVTEAGEKSASENDGVDQ